MTREELRATRIALGLLQREMAEELGYSADHLRHLENGQAEIPKRLEKQIDRLVMQKKLEKMTSQGKNPLTG